MRTWVMGDIHGNYRGLVQCLERSGFNRKEDVLIQLGDIADGWSEVYECVELLLSIPNLISIKGNHDEEFYQWLTYGWHRWNWLQGAHKTAQSYIKHAERKDITLLPKNGGYMTNLTTVDVPLSHQLFFEAQALYYIDDENNCFVHGGFNRHIEFKHQGKHIYCWDRDLWAAALSFKQVNYEFKMKNKFKEVFIGHTATTNWFNNEELSNNGLIKKVSGVLLLRLCKLLIYGT